MFRLPASCHQLLYNLTPSPPTPLSPPNSFLRVTWDAVFQACSPKNSHWIKHNSQLRGCDYFLSQQGSEKKRPLPESPSIAVTRLVPAAPGLMPVLLSSVKDTQQADAAWKKKWCRRASVTGRGDRVGFAMFPKTCRDSSMVLITERLCWTLVGWEGGEGTLAQGSQPPVNSFHPPGGMFSGYLIPG